MAQFMSLGIQQYRHQFVILFFQRGIGINIKNIDCKTCQARLAAQLIQRSEHVMAEVAIIAAEQPQGGLIYP